MKLMKRGSCFLAAMTLCILNTLAANSAHPNEDKRSLPANIKISPWAQEGVEQALELGFGPTANELRFLPDALNEPASKGNFCAYSARLIAFQQNCDEPSLREIILYDKGDFDRYGQIEPVFLDVPLQSEETAMYYLGVAKGRGNGYLGAGDKLTRQEAAVLLARVYETYGGKLNVDQVGPDFVDQKDIANWAKNSVNALHSAGIMKGYEDGRFAPEDFYSYEQCLVTLVRLYQNMPVSRKNGNVVPLYTYEQYCASIEKAGNLAALHEQGVFKIQQIEGKEADFVQQRVVGGMYRQNKYKFVYRSGRIREITDFGVCDTGQGVLSRYVEPQNIFFSEDGKTLYCTIILPDEIESPPQDTSNPILHGHEAGIYQVTVDVETGQAQAVRRE